MAAPLPKPHYSTPSNNYLSGDGMSHVFEGPGYYVPSERGWTKSLPRETRRDAIDMQSHDQWDPWPKCDAWVPIQREGRGEYYGYYHEAIEREQERRKKEFPTSWRVEPRDVPQI
ncbi:hypothetical protein MAR_006348 [Mya arenaria]|uniref:Uncharacterized protein n=1 Tax=Mya arenaria TaxID=6604 RepID=A0ABY7D879_MYAAR|nr:hypothetical protein MAR_006348 [Mya arenaria]